MKTMKVWMGGCWVACLLLTSSALAFDLQGHRGARGLAPENTLPAFARALSLGVTALELNTANLLAHRTRELPPAPRGPNLIP